MNSSNSGVGLAPHAGNEGSTTPSAGQPNDPLALLRDVRALINGPLMTVDAELAWASRAKSSGAIVGNDHLTTISKALTRAYDLLGAAMKDGETVARMAVWRAAIVEHDAKKRDADAGQETLSLVPRQSAPAFANAAGAR